MTELTTEQITEFGTALVEIRDEIEAALNTGAEAVKPVDLDEPIGRLSRMDAIQQQQMARATRSALDLRRQQVMAALAAIASGSYGACRKCEEPIDLARLRARPESPLCVDCQEEIESH